MGKVFSVLLRTMFTVLFFAMSLAQAQSLQDLKQQYKSQSPLPSEGISTKQVIDAGESNMTPQEAQVAEMRAQQDDEKKAQVEKVYLDTDYEFFQALAVPEEEDEMDQETKKDEVAKIIEKSRWTDKTVRKEIVTTTPGMMSRKEGAAMDHKRVQILRKIAVNGQHVRKCILQFKTPGEFKGTAMTLAWEVNPAGKVENAKMKATDVDNREIQACVLKALAEWNFQEAVKEQGKRARIEYTYRFISATKEASNRKPASMN